MTNGEGYEQQTCLGHHWVVRSADGKELMSVLAGDGSHYVVPKPFQKANLNSTIDDESTASVA